MSELLPPDKRLVPLTAEQHEEIATLIYGSMEGKHPEPELTYEGRIVVKRSVTRLARLAGVGRLKSHSKTFRRAVVAFERKVQEGGFKKKDIRSDSAAEREGRLVIDHLWRWLHGYTKPIEPRWADRHPEPRSLPQLLDNFGAPPGLMRPEGIGDDFADNIRPSGDTLEFNGQHIPIMEVRKWIREVHPQTIRMLCVGPPGDPLFAARPHVHALYSSICGDRACFFSLEHGGWVCKKHVTPEYCLVSIVDGEIDENTYPSMGYWDCTGADPVLVSHTQTEVANTAFALIEAKAFQFWRKDNPDSPPDRFEQWFREYWDGIAPSLTNQVRVSTAPVLWGKEGVWAN